MHSDSRIMYFFKNAWPTIQRLINNILYLIIMVMRSIVKTAFEQIRKF